MVIIFTKYCCSAVEETDIRLQVRTLSAMNRPTGHDCRKIKTSLRQDEQISSLLEQMICSGPNASVEWSFELTVILLIWRRGFIRCDIPVTLVVLIANLETLNCVAVRRLYGTMGSGASKTWTSESAMICALLGRDRNTLDKLLHRNFTVRWKLLSRLRVLIPNFHFTS